VAASSPRRLAQTIVLPSPLSARGRQPRIGCRVTRRDQHKHPLAGASRVARKAAPDTCTRSLDAQSAHR